MAGLLQFEGSMIPDSVRRAAQNALWDSPATSMDQARAAQEAASLKAAEAAKGAGWSESGKGLSLKEFGSKGLGLLNTAGKALGGPAAAYDLVTSANDKYGMGAWDRAQEMAKKRDERLAYEAKQQGSLGSLVGSVGTVASAASGLYGLAKEGVSGLAKYGQELNAESQALSEGKKAIEAEVSKEAIPMTPAKQAQVEQVTEAVPQIEAARQQLQAGTLSGLKTGEVHVSQLAEGVVQADSQRAGTQLKPEEQKAAVQAEIQAMKTMDNDQLSKYVSYALMAGGILASVFDKTGTAGRQFHDSFNKQLDRNLAAGKMSMEMQQNAAKNALEDRKVSATERNIDSQVEGRLVSQRQRDRELGQGDQKIGLMRDTNDIRRFSANESAAAARQRLGLMSDTNDIALKRLALQDADTKSKIKAREAAASGSGAKGEKLGFKDNMQVVSDVYKSQKLKVDPQLQSQIAARMPTLQKQYPQLSAAELVELAASEYDTEVDPGMPIFGSDTARIRQPK